MYWKTKQSNAVKDEQIGNPVGYVSEIQAISAGGGDQYLTPLTSKAKTCVSDLMQTFTTFQTHKG